LGFYIFAPGQSLNLAFQVKEYIAVGQLAHQQDSAQDS
jgi:hypothetical protein